MKNLHKSLSLPKITSKFIEDLLKQNSHSPLPRTNIKRLTYNKNKQNLQFQRNNRYTEADYRLSNNQFSKNKSNQILEVSSPFYKKINIQNVKSPKCQCHLFHGDQSLQFPLVKKSPCAYHQQIIENKVIQTKKYQQKIVNSLKLDHANIHEKIDQYEMNYATYSLENSQRIRAQKYINSKKNAQEFKVKLEKIKSQDNIRKEMNKVLLKDKLDQVYNLDNENQPYEKIMQMRNKWYKEKKLWAAKILKAIHQELKQVRINKQKISVSNQKKQFIKISQNENILLDIEKCLAVILNNVESIEELLVKGKIDKVTSKVQQIFKKNLQIKERSYGKKLCKKLSQIAQKFYAYPKEQQSKVQKDQYKEKVNNNDWEEDLKIQNEKVIEMPLKVRQDLKSQSKDSTLLNRNEEIIQNCSKIQTSDLKNQESIKKQRSPKISDISIKSNISKRSLSSKRQNKDNIITNSLKISKKTSLADEKQNLNERQNTGRSMKSHRSIKSKGSSKNIKQSIKYIPSPQGVKNQINYSVKLTPHITPSLSQHVIDQLDEFIQADDNEEIDSDYQDEYAKQKALKFIQTTRIIKQKQQKEQNQRIDYVIDYVKARIRLRQANKLAIPKKYQNIQYQKYCTQNTFKYIASMIDEFEGTKKFTFLFGQLRLKKHILDDQYIHEAIQTFKQMFQNEQQFSQWKDYLFEQRNKMIFQKLNRMIDLGMKEINNFKFQEEVIALPESEQQRFKSKQFAIFNKVDQSQIAYENYLQKMQRKKESKRNSTHIIQRDLNININKQNKSKLNRNQDKDQIVTQKTIYSHIQSSSTKSIRYTFVENEKSINSLKRGVYNLNKNQKINLSDNGDKKKVLKYLLKKRPQQFQILNKDVNEFSQFVKTNFGLQKSPA